MPVAVALAVAPATVVRRDVGEAGDQVAAHVVGVLVDGDRGGGVRAVDQHRSVAHAGPRDELRNLAGDVDETAPRWLVRTWNRMRSPACSAARSRSSSTSPSPGTPGGPGTADPTPRPRTCPRPPPPRCRRAGRPLGRVARRRHASASGLSVMRSTRRRVCSASSTPGENIAPSAGEPSTNVRATSARSPASAAGRYFRPTSRPRRSMARFMRSVAASCPSFGLDLVVEVDDMSARFSNDARVSARDCSNATWSSSEVCIDPSPLVFANSARQPFAASRSLTSAASSVDCVFVSIPYRS